MRMRNIVLIPLYTKLPPGAVLDMPTCHHPSHDG
jgi:hypothetical protein